VQIARALMTDPEVLLLDEPAAGLDLPGRETLVRALEDAGDLADVPSILVTHHPEEIPATTSHVALLREGTVMAVGPADEVMTASALSACFGLALGVARTAGRWSVAAAR